jgi:hypothetical protein
MGKSHYWSTIPDGVIMFRAQYGSLAGAAAVGARAARRWHCLLHAIFTASIL